MLPILEGESLHTVTPIGDLIQVFPRSLPPIHQPKQYLKLCNFGDVRKYWFLFHTPLCGEPGNISARKTPSVNWRLISRYHDTVETIIGIGDPTCNSQISIEYSFCKGEGVISSDSIWQIDNCHLNPMGLELIIRIRYRPREMH